MMPGIEALQKSTSKKSKEPDSLSFIYHLLISKGITPKQIRDDFTIPDILDFVRTELYIKEQERKAAKRKR